MVGRYSRTNILIDDKGREWVITSVTPSKTSFQAYIPKKILNALGVKVGDHIAFHYDKKTKLVLLRKVKVMMRFE